MATLGSLFRDHWGLYLGSFLVTGLVVVFAQVLMELFPEKPWAGALASIPISLMIVYILRLRRVAHYLFGLVWVNFYTLLLQVFVFVMVVYVPLSRSSRAFVYGMLSLALLVWIALVLLHGYLWSKPLCLAFRVDRFEPE